MHISLSVLLLNKFAQCVHGVFIKSNQYVYSCCMSTQKRERKLQYTRGVRYCMSSLHQFQPFKYTSTLQTLHNGVYIVALIFTYV